MKKSIGKYIMKKNQELLREIDFHDFMNMVESNLCDEEMASELGVHKEYIKRLKNEIKKDF
ncbi:hypothetical protein [Inediibacterium massiliense]|uniref:hypothetical protein n=1 Tax=Inediibacterium massiliense TaxID=1658111 RepID=UPI0006B5CB09|nr:hypothetical protein [Inediibacterium massiliense]